MNHSHYLSRTCYISYPISKGTSVLISNRSCRHLRTYSHCRDKEDKSESNPKAVAMEVRLMYFPPSSSSPCNILSCKLSCQDADSHGRDKAGRYGSGIKLFKVYVRCGSKYLLNSRILTCPQVNPHHNHNFQCIHNQPHDIFQREHRFFPGVRWA